MNRRGFLSLLPALGAIAALPVALGSKPKVVLYGDGKHDDTFALNEWGAGRQVYWSSGEPVGNVLRNKWFLTTATVVITRQDPCWILSNTFDFRGSSRAFRGVIAA